MAANHALLSSSGSKDLRTCRQQLHKRDSEMPQSPSSCAALSDEVQAVADQGTSSEFSDDASSSHKDPFIDEDYMLTVFERYAN